MPIGTFVNAAAVLVGTTLGLVFGRLIPERIRTATMATLGLTIFLLGMQMALNPQVDQGHFQVAGRLPYHPNPLVIIGGMVAGAMLGEFFQLEKRLEQFGNRMQALVSSVPALTPGQPLEAADKGHGLVEGFVTATLMFCIGAMAVVGPIQDAMGQPHVLYVKAMLDGISSIMLASTLGIGVGISAFAILLYQGGITLAASSVTPYLTLPMLATLTATGGLLIAAIGIDLMGIKRLAVGNMLPGVFVASLLAYFVG